MSIEYGLTRFDCEVGTNSTAKLHGAPRLPEQWPVLPGAYVMFHFHGTWWPWHGHHDFIHGKPPCLCRRQRLLTICIAKIHLATVANWYHKIIWYLSMNGCFKKIIWRLPCQCPLVLRKICCLQPSSCRVTSMCSLKIASSCFNIVEKQLLKPWKTIENSI
jgi:hypothetical protein